MPAMRESGETLAVSIPIAKAITGTLLAKRSRMIRPLATACSIHARVVDLLMKSSTADARYWQCLKKI
jgi:hypothetical protein